MMQPMTLPAMMGPGMGGMSPAMGMGSPMGSPMGYPMGSPMGPAMGPAMPQSPMWGGQPSFNMPAPSWSNPGAYPGGSYYPPGGSDFTIGSPVSFLVNFGPSQFILFNF